MKGIGDIPARRVMSRPVRGVKASAPLAEAARRMALHRIGALAVLDARGRGVGVISASDIVAYEATRARRVLGPGRFLQMRPRPLGREAGGISFEWSGDAAVGDVMTRGIISAPAATATLGQAAALMSRHGVHRVFLVQDRRILGLVTSFDVAKAVGKASAAP